MHGTGVIDGIGAEVIGGMDRWNRSKSGTMDASFQGRREPAGMIPPADTTVTMG
jgi:hypothetical protein